MENLKAYFSPRGFAPAETNQIAATFVQKILRKGDYFVEEGKTSRYPGFFEKGFLQYD